MSETKRILQAVRELPVPDRLRLVERIIHELAESSDEPRPVANVVGAWADMRAEADAIVDDAMHARETRPWRTPSA